MNFRIIALLPFLVLTGCAPIQSRVAAYGESLKSLTLAEAASQISIDDDPYRNLVIITTEKVLPEKNLPISAHMLAYKERKTGRLHYSVVLTANATMRETFRIYQVAYRFKGESYSPNLQDSYGVNCQGAGRYGGCDQSRTVVFSIPTEHIDAIVETIQTNPSDRKLLGMKIFNNNGDFEFAFTDVEIAALVNKARTYTPR